MKLSNSKNVFVYFLLIISIILFFGFGFYHIAKFETVDEHFWKYERTGKYWHGLKLGFTERKWEKTYINDKPGVTTAIISGVGLLFEPNPESSRIRDPKLTNNQLYTVYNTERTEKINLALRLPLLIFNSLSFLFFFWIIRKITDNEWLALLAVILMTLSPILLGISQIINPDTLLWTFVAASIFSYFALLKNEQKKFIVLTALFTGLGLLSKYTANILFPLYFVIFLSNLFINFESINKNLGTRKYISRQLFYFLLITLGSVLVFSFFLPAVFEKIKYLYRGTIGSQAFESTSLPFVIFIILVLTDNLLFKSKIIQTTCGFFNKYKEIIFKIFAFLILSMFIFVIINPWSNNPVIPLDDVKENAFVDKDLIFPMLAEHNPVLRWVIMLATEMQSFVFSLLPITIIILLFLWVKTLYAKSGKYALYIFIISAFTLIYFIASLSSGVLANPRYSIILYPLLAFLSAIGIYELSGTKIIQQYVTQKNTLIISTFVIFFVGTFSLWKIKPFYLNYESFFLPKKYTVIDAWGYGEYEAAQYLNSLPDSETLVIWSDRGAICQFLKGHCIRNYEIDLNKTIPDYFVFSRRGAIRHKFEWKYPELAQRSSLNYYSDDVLDNSDWSIHIGGKEKNFVKVIKTIEK